jgi:hypothetical protein
MITDCPPITEIPDYVWRMKQPSYIPRPRRNEPKDTAPIFYHANGEEALKAAKNGARRNGRWFGRESVSGCFCVYEGGKVVERHITKKEEGDPKVKST